MADRVSVFYLGEQPTTLIDKRQKIQLFQSGSVPLAQATQERTSTAHALLGCDAMSSMLCPVAFGVQPVTYTAYGYNINSPAIVQGFSGQLRNLLQNAYILGNGVRVFSTTLMRFYSPDFLYSPFGAGDINTYAYCGCEPVNNSDASGHVAVRPQGNYSILTRKWISMRPGLRSRSNRKNYTPPSRTPILDVNQESGPSNNGQWGLKHFIERIAATRLKQQNIANSISPTSQNFSLAPGELQNLQAAPNDAPLPKLNKSKWSGRTAEETMSIRRELVSIWADTNLRRETYKKYGMTREEKNLMYKWYKRKKK